MLALIGVLVALAGHPGYQLCGHHHCSRSHRAFEVRCGGVLWLSPRRVHVPRGLPRWECPAVIPPF